MARPRWQNSTTDGIGVGQKGRWFDCRQRDIASAASDLGPGVPSLDARGRSRFLETATARNYGNDLQSLERPLVVFWGVLDQRMDAQFLATLAGALEHGTIVLAGPEADP